MNMFLKELRCPKCHKAMKQIPNRLWYWVCTDSMCGEVVDGSV